MADRVEIDAAVEALLGAYRAKRAEALDIIKRSMADPASTAPATLTSAQLFLNGWRQFQAEDLQKLIADDAGDDNRRSRMPQDERSPATPAQAPDLIAVAQRHWPRASQALENVPTEELKLRLHAARVLKHAPDVLAVSDLLDDEDVTRTLLAVAAATDLIQQDFAAVADDELLELLLDLPYDVAGVVSPDVLDEARADPNFQEASGDVASEASAPTPSRLQWAQETAARIEKHIRAYIEEQRWTPLGQHFGAIVTDLQDRLWRLILSDPDPIRYELAPDTAVTISLLKATIGPDHTDNLLGVTAWWEAMQLYVEETGRKEIPPAVIRQLAADYHVPLMQPAPQPKL